MTLHYLRGRPEWEEPVHWQWLEEMEKAGVLVPITEPLLFQAEWEATGYRTRWCIVHKSQPHADAWPPPDYCQDAYYRGKGDAGECDIVNAVVVAVGEDT